MGPTQEHKQSMPKLLGMHESGLLEYHRWQRQERLREQEMERLVSRGRAGGGLQLHCGELGRPVRRMRGP